MQINFISNKYQLRRLTRENVDEIYELESQNALYFEHCPPFITKQGILEELEALPPGKSIQDKYYIGFYRENKLIAVMDFIDGYPEKEIAYIGLFMTDLSIQGKGIGTEIIDELCAYLAKSGYASVRLAWVKGNPQAEHFWLKNHFSPIKESKSNVADVVILAERVLR